MNKIQASVLAFMFCLAAPVRAESPVGSGVPNYSLDSGSCFSWTGNTSGASWTKCSTPAPVVITQPAPPPQVIYVPSTPAPEKKIEIVKKPKKVVKKKVAKPPVICTPAP